jgi:phenylacetate-CoA ligase
MIIRVEAAQDIDETALQKTVQEITKLKAQIEVVPPDSLPNDGKVIDDIRTYE